jgi:hypothetical protein
MYFGGAGIGMALSGIGIPVVLAWGGQGTCFAEGCSARRTSMI